MHLSSTVHQNKLTDYGLECYDPTKAADKNHPNCFLALNVTMSRGFCAGWVLEKEIVNNTVTMKTLIQLFKLVCAYKPTDGNNISKGQWNISSDTNYAKTCINLYKTCISPENPS